MRKKNPQLEADKRLLQYADYEDYLDSFITIQDRCFLQNLYVCRKFSEIGYRNWGETLSEDVFKKRYEAVYNYVHPEFIPYLLVSENTLCPDQIHKELAQRERPNRLGVLSTIIHLRIESDTGHEVSGYIDYSERLENENWRAFFQGHCHLRKHLLRMGSSDTNEFRFCGEEEETPIHPITDCFGIASLGRECLGRETCKSEEPASLKPSQILDFIRFLELEREL